MTTGQQSPPNNVMATASLASGIAGVTVAPLIGSIAALICGYKARRQLAAAPGREGGEGMATAGIVLGWIGTVLAIVGAIIFLAFFAFVSDQVSSFNNEIKKQDQQSDEDARKQEAAFQRKARENRRRFARETARDQRENERRLRATRAAFERRARRGRERIERLARENEERIERRARESMRQVPSAVPMAPPPPEPLPPQP